MPRKFVHHSARTQIVIAAWTADPAAVFLKRPDNGVDTFQIPIRSLALSEKFAEWFPIVSFPA